MQVTDTDRQHWAFLPLREIQIPTADDAWSRTPVDQFIRQAQAAKGLTPAPAADMLTLIRRVYFDLIGLPPSPEAVEAFVRQTDPSDRSNQSAPSTKAYAALIEKLLTSPQYGERWARHWLDVARYADSNGYEADHDRPNAYHFRDFVIRALNSDMPADQFMRWQLAGDEIAPDKPDAIAATGFLTAGTSIILDIPMQEEKLRSRANELDDIVSTTGQAMLGLTLACARCHDHKYDPLPTRDYYRLMSIFNSGDRKNIPLASPAEVKAHDAAMAKWKQEFNTAVKERETWLKAARPSVADRLRADKISRLPIPDDEKQLLSGKSDDPAAKKLADRFKKELNADDAAAVSALLAADAARWQALDDRVKALEKSKPSEIPQTFAFADFEPEPRESWLFERGDFLARNQKVSAGFLTVLQKDKSPADYWQAARSAKVRDDSTQQRRALADWMTDLDQGAGRLLARVLVESRLATPFWRRPSAQR